MIHHTIHIIQSKDIRSTATSIDVKKELIIPSCITRTFFFFEEIVHFIEYVNPLHSKCKLL